MFYKKNIKKKLFRLLMVILFLPLFQQVFNVVEVGKLWGYIIEEEAPKLNSRVWFNEDYQKQTEKYLNQNFGFRNWFVRINNQISFSLYNKAKANGVMIGKDNYLYEYKYIDAYYGDDFLSKPYIDSCVLLYKEIQNALKKLDKKFLIVFAAGKGSFYPEYFPDYARKEKQGITNLDYYVSQLKKQNISFIDFNTWFCEMKDTSKYPLYPQTGIHWSNYGMFLAMDSMVGYVEFLLQKDLPDLIVDSIFTTDNILHSDKDIEDGMNLVFEIPKYDMSYHKFHVNDKNKYKPKAIVISDSYYWEMFNSGISKNIFRDGKFWYYNKQVFPDSYKKKTMVKDLDYVQELLKADIVILMVTEALLPEFDWGFSEIMKRDFLKKINLDTVVINKKMEHIRNDKKWFALIKRKAKERNITVDSMLYLDAVFMAKLEDKKK